MKGLTIEINGKERKFSFGLGFIGELIEGSGIDISEIITKLNANPYKYTPEYMYYSHKYERESLGEVMELTKYDFGKWIDDHPKLYAADEVKSFIEGLLKSLTKDVPAQEATETEEVKKN